MLQSVLVGIDSFDSPNKDQVKPKDFVNTVDRGRFQNRGPIKEKHQDKRSANDEDWYIYNGECEDVQILLLSSHLPEALDCSESTQNADYVRDGQKNVSSVVASKRRRGYFKRKDMVGQRRSNKIDIIWTSIKSYRKYEIVDEDLLYNDNTYVPRIELNINDTFNGTNFNRPLYLPSGINVDDMVYDTFTNATRQDDVKRMFAVGCTCRDMLFRGAVEARYGCKHMIAWEKARAKEDGSLWK